jgi:hypothetical protein
LHRTIPTTGQGGSYVTYWKLVRARRGDGIRGCIGCASAVGEYTVEVVARDLNRDVEGPLKTRFRLVEVDSGAASRD